MKQPPYFEEVNRVCLLKKSLYGLKQAPRQWNIKFHSFLDEFGFNRSNADPCVYSSHIDGVIVILALYVDDGLFFSQDKQQMDMVVGELKSRFEVIIGDANCYAGMNVIRNRQSREIMLSQEHYVKRILEKYNEKRRR